MFENILGRNVVYIFTYINIYKTYIYMCVYIYVPEKAMASHSSTLAWKIPWTEEPGGLQSMESQRVRHNLGTEHASTRKLSTGKRCSRVKNLQGP